MVDLNATIQKYPDCLDSRQKLKAILSDIYYEHGDKAQIHLLLLVYDAGFINEAKQNAADVSFASRMTQKIVTQYSIEESKAMWAVQQWCIALGIKFPCEMEKAIHTSVDSAELKQTENLNVKVIKASALTTQTAREFSYNFIGSIYTKMPDLATALAKNWEVGKKELYRGILSSYFKSCRPEIAGYCMDAEEAVKQNHENPDLVFLQFLHKIDPEFSHFAWKVLTHGSLESFGEEILRNLWSGERKNDCLWEEILKNQLLSKYWQFYQGSNSCSKSIIETLEANISHDLSDRDIETLYYKLGYVLSHETRLYISDQFFSSNEEVLQYMKQLMEKSFVDFSRFSDKLIDSSGALTPQTEAWLDVVEKDAFSESNGELV